MPTRFQVDVTASAERDLVAMRDHIAADNPAAARKWVAAVARKIGSLGRFPLRHPVIPEAALLGVDYRHLVTGSYRIVYRVAEERVIVIRVIHGAQLLAAPGSG